MKKKHLIFLFLFSISLPGFMQTTAQWRGPARDGIYPETGLLTAWPAEGPRLLWKADSLGNGYSSPVIANGKVYVPGEIDSTGYLFALDKNGSVLWKAMTGPEWNINFPGPRSTPTVAGNRIYYLAGKGDLVCLDAENGKRIWSVNLITDLHGTTVRFGYTEAVVVDGEKVYCTPGGKDTNIVALDRFTGKLLWKSKVMGDTGAFCSPLLVTLPGRKVLVTMVIHHLVGVDAATGELLWSQKFERPNDIHCNTPIYENGSIYYNDRGGNGMVKLEMAPDGRSVKEVWRNFKAGNVQSGFVKLGNYLYGSRYRPGRFEVQDAATGEATDSLKFGCGSTIFADGLLYCYNDQGMVGLILPNQGKAEVVSTFKVEAGTQEHFSHPVICDGVLYIRHGKALMAYDIRKH